MRGFDWCGRTPLLKHVLQVGMWRCIASLMIMNSSHVMTQLRNIVICTVYCIYDTRPSIRGKALLLPSLNFKKKGILINYTKIYLVKVQR